MQPWLLIDGGDFDRFALSDVRDEFGGHTDFISCLAMTNCWI